jgi:hypothetical protein
MSHIHCIDPMPSSVLFIHRIACHPSSRPVLVQSVMACQSTAAHSAR